MCSMTLSSFHVESSSSDGKPSASQFRALGAAARNAFFKYDTPRLVSVHSVSVGLLNRVVQISIIAYVVGFALIYEKGYQQTDTLESTVTTKVKGLVVASGSGHEWISRVWDTADYVVPPLENGAFFVTTNAVVTPNQQHGTCPESPIIANGKCLNHTECPVDVPVISGNGIRTGICNNLTSTCDIFGWCPTEVDILPEEPVLKGTENLTVLVKNYIVFPRFHTKRQSISLTANSSRYFATCLYHPETDPLCPVFRLGDIVSFSGERYEELVHLGAIIGIIIEWNCNLDYDIALCLPKYTFRRIDDRLDETSKGWNFRYADYWTDAAGEERRTLMKVYGIRFVFYVSGQAGKFSIVPFLTNIGAGLALLHVVTFFCDFFLLHVVKFKQQYSDHKFETVSGYPTVKTTDSVTIAADLAMK
ncbi:P2X purinoceptor 4 [Hypsibius exemplaris]|uniref:P2X purinoceptor 4 n=1 Tax=Hypsibius exemplaris TaxID=2072580 RepID=A0A1W0WGF5_HYPEX|nr:P2X purinoceptor 4 [Hypsibius exemplaris]